MKLLINILSPKYHKFYRFAGTVSVVSLLGSCGFYFLQIGNFIGNFLVFSVFQVILFSFISQIIKNYFNKELREIELQKLESLSTILDCSYCKKPNLVVFDPNEKERLEFVCDKCNKKNLVTIQFTVSQVFEPLEIAKITGTPTTTK